MLIGVAPLVGCTPSQPARSAQEAQQVLPLRTLRLYETGVGYFEREGKLDSDSSMTLPVPASHLDDALKTLVVVSREGRARVGGVEFASRITPGLARKLAGLPSVTDQPITYRALLASLAGAHVEVTVRRPLPSEDDDREEPEDSKGKRSYKRKQRPHYEVLHLSGRLVDVVEERRLDETDGDKKELVVLLMTDAGELRRIRAEELEALRPTDKALAARIDAALDALTSRATQRQRKLRVLASSSGPVTLGYVAETPVWRSTYRLMLEPDGKAANLQGWALIHNDTDETWRGITVELVNGRPDSFLFPLAAPRYGRRPLAEPAEQLSTAPQLMERTTDQIWGDHFDEGGGGYGTGQGFGSGHGRLGGSHRTRAPKVRMGSTVSESTALSVGNLADIAPAEGIESGALFSYKLASPVDLRPHGSAMLPFMDGRVEVRRLTLFARPDEAGRAAVRVVNITKQTLPAGPVTVYEHGGFAGETGVDRMKPKQRTFLPFAVDLDIEVERVDSKRSEDVQHVSQKDERLNVDLLRTTRWKLELKSRGAGPRRVYLKLDLVNNASVSGADEMDYDTANSQAYAVFKLEPGQKLEREVVMVEGIQRSNHRSTLDAEKLDELAKQDRLPEADRKLLVQAAALLRQRETQNKELRQLEERRSRLNEDLSRLREHLKSLGGDKGAAGPASGQLVQRVLRAEDELTSVLDKIAAANRDRTGKLEALTKLLEGLTPPPVPKAFPKPAAPKAE